MTITVDFIMGALLGTIFGLVSAFVIVATAAKAIKKQYGK